MGVGSPLLPYGRGSEGEPDVSGRWRGHGITIMRYRRYREHDKGSKSPLMRVAIIGGSGHIGSYLTPRLVEAGHSVLCVSRGLRQPYVAHAAWKRVESVLLDRDAEEAAGRFGAKVRDLDPDCVIDLTAYTRESTQQL